MTASLAKPTDQRNNNAALPDNELAWQALRILTFYRLILAGLLIVLYISLPDSNPFNVTHKTLFSVTLLSYLLASIAIGFATRLHWPGYPIQASLQVLFDISAISLLMHASGGVNSSLGALLVVAVAGGVLILPGRIGFLFTAIATLALLGETWLATLSAQNTGAGSIARAGLLGAVLFIAAGIAYVLAKRMRESEALAKRHAIDLANLEQLNRYIIQQLQSGVLVVDASNRIRLANHMANTLLNLDTGHEKNLDSIAPELTQQLNHWRRDPNWPIEPIDAGGSTLIPRFGPLTTAQGEGALILLEDSAHLDQQSQQIKLASLGRLTASIAHEIRNPLGAISHAAQLLDESDQLDREDQRLAEIIGDHTRRVNTIIENVLQLSRRSASQPQNLCLKDWLQDFHSEFVASGGISTEQLNINVKPQELEIHADPGQLYQIMSNLCRNAFRHAGSNAQVCIQGQQEQNGMIQLDIIDNGPGIDDETAKKIFEPFYTTAGSGTGLGLYIAHELCESNHARLSFQQAKGGGSCFRIRFPAPQTGL